MAYQVKITPAALANVDEIFLWLDEGNPGRAVDWFNGLLVAFNSLANMPRRCAIAPETELVGIEIRCLYYQKFYKILFAIEGNVVTIHHIRHTSRDFPSFNEFYGIPDP